ncbi:MAG: hypothetical protein COA57_05245 [Flavobacteriales bacterium]|nr:PorP/SprF family type IX secretion system membrane protein [Bacteroidales bacterium AH-315-I05]PCJ87085.1 MAG: hypothetical protein COA57_05245 [Flavobacteriales bacterium]
MSKVTRSILSFTFIVQLAFGQDLHFSQYYQTPLSVNPALTGFFDGNQRVFLNYKSQWSSVSNAYQTYAFSADAALLKKKWENSYIGGGLSVFNDKAGEAELGLTQANVSFAGILGLNDKNKASVGLQAGFAQRTMSNSSLRWSSQYNQGVFDSGMPSGEQQNFENFTFADVSFGLAWRFHKPKSRVTGKKEMIVNAGIAGFHVNKPKQKYYDVGQEQLYSKWAAHLDGNIGLTDAISLMPSVLYLRQGPSQEINAGAMIRVLFNEQSEKEGLSKEMAVAVGGYYRAADAIIPSILIEVANFALGITYDVNVSPLKTASSGKGGVEISLRYVNPSPFRQKGAKSRVKFE